MHIKHSRFGFKTTFTDHKTGDKDMKT